MILNVTWSPTVSNCQTSHFFIDMTKQFRMNNLYFISHVYQDLYLRYLIFIETFSHHTSQQHYQSWVSRKCPETIYFHERTWIFARKCAIKHKRVLTRTSSQETLKTLPSCIAPIITKSFTRVFITCFVRFTSYTKINLLLDRSTNTWCRYSRYSIGAHHSRFVLWAYLNAWPWANTTYIYLIFLWARLSTHWDGSTIQHRF